MFKGVQVAEHLQMQKKKAWIRIDHILRESTSSCVDASSVQQLFTVDHRLNSQDDKIMACSNYITTKLKS